MPSTAFGLTPEQKDVVKKYCPNWPMVDLGQSIHRQTGQLSQALSLPNALNDDVLKTRVDVGRLELQKLLECDIDRMFELAASLGYIAHESAQNYQVRMTANDNPTELWEFTDRSPSHHNLGTVEMDGAGFGWAAFNENGKNVLRRYDPILSVLESLEVGRIAANVKWEQRRTINAIVHPQGPNVYLEAYRDRQYELEKHPTPNTVRTAMLPNV